MGASPFMRAARLLRASCKQHWIYVDTDPSLHARIKLEDFTVNLAHWTVTLAKPNQPLALIIHEIDWHCCYLAERAEETLPT